MVAIPVPAPRFKLDPMAVAIHETGHAIVALAFGHEVVLVTLRPSPDDASSVHASVDRRRCSWALARSAFHRRRGWSDTAPGAAHELRHIMARTSRG
jgi:hypothetical protein